MSHNDNKRIVSKGQIMVPQEVLYLSRSFMGQVSLDSDLTNSVKRNRK